MSDTRPAPILSLILCSRNDAYMGNSKWRLETTLNYTCAQITELGCRDQVEIIVADWGSEQPLCHALALDPVAAETVSFVSIPQDLAHELQGESPFPEVIAINAAARRARGMFIGRIDQDTLVGPTFLRTFLDWAEHGWPARAPLDQSLLFSCRRAIPYRFAVRCPEYSHVDRLIRWFGRWLFVERAPELYRSAVGIWLLHRDLWAEAAGYDERMIFMNDMEIDMATRLMSRYPFVDLGAMVGHDFYHLDHYHPRGPRLSSAHRRVNAPLENMGSRPSGNDWGLAGYRLQSSGIEWCLSIVAKQRYLSAVPAFVVLSAWVWLRSTADWLYYRKFGDFRHRWGRRVRGAREAVSDQPVTSWPSVLMKAWTNRPSAGAGS